MISKFTYYTIVFVAFVAVLTSGCWEKPNDYWADVDTSPPTDTQSEEADGGECYETDYDCIDGGL